MNPPASKCPKCGAKLAGRFCRQCLLLAGLDTSLFPTEAVSTPGLMQDEMIVGLFPELKNFRRIGRGGMGVVYQAQQREVDRDIALKLLPLELSDDKEAEQRFEIEARAAARLDHPHIITLYEFGKRGGSLFLKMKLIEAGRSLAHALKEQSPWPVKKSVALLIKLARAVHHAHQHGVIHRDIKPGNVLLDPQEQPHLSDFGLARLMEENMALTRSQMVLGTVSYMAPEQAEGSQSGSTTTSDVYSLGAVLYEMLTGRPPFAGASTAEVLHRVIDEDPVPPGAVNPAVDRDLSTICLKCLEKNPAKRFGSAEALAQDLTLWEQGLPISARPLSAPGRITKWARRRPAIAALAGALAASVIAGSTLAIWQAVRATRAENIAKEEAANASRAEKSARNEAANATRAEKSTRDEAAINKAVNAFLNNDLLGAANPNRETDRELKVRTVLDRASKRIGSRFEDQPLVEAAIQLTLASAYLSLGEYEKAQRHAERSVELRQRVLGPENPDTLRSRNDLANALQLQGQYARAEAEHRAILEIRQRVLGAEHPDTLMSRNNLANTLHDQSKFAEAEAEHRAVLKIRARLLGAEHPDTLMSQMNLANALKGERKFSEAEAEESAVLKTQLRILGREHPDTLKSRMNLANIRDAQGRFAEAEAELRSVVKIDERVLGAEHPETLLCRMNLGNTLNHQKKYPEAEAELRAVLAVQERVVGPEHPLTLFTLHDLAVSLRGQQKLDEARAFAKRAMGGRRKVFGAAHPKTKSSEALYQTLTNPELAQLSEGGKDAPGEEASTAAVLAPQLPGNPQAPADVTAVNKEAPALDPHTTASPVKFWFDYPYTPSPGIRIWTKIDKDTWTEEYDGGVTSRFKVAERAVVDEASGTVVSKVDGDPLTTQTLNGDHFQVFIPDIGSPNMRISNRSKKNGKWSRWKVLTNMQGVE